MTMLLHAARIVNSTPLWETDDYPNEPQPISPQMLITQLEDACKQAFMARHDFAHVFAARSCTTAPCRDL